MPIKLNIFHLHRMVCRYRFPETLLLSDKLINDVMILAFNGISNISVKLASSETGCSH